MSNNNWTSADLQVDFFSSPQTDLIFAYNYSLLFKLEYFAGYEKSLSGALLVNSPIWLPMTSTILEGLTSSPALCRFRKYTNPEIGVYETPGLDLQIKDQHFFLASSAESYTKSQLPEGER